MNAAELLAEWKKAAAERDENIRNATAWRPLGLEDQVRLAHSDLQMFGWFIDKLIKHCAELESRAAGTEVCRG